MGVTENNGMAETLMVTGFPGFCNFFSIYFHLPIDTKYLKCYLYIIINNKTKTNVMKNLIASLKNLFSKKSNNNTFDLIECEFNTLYLNSLKYQENTFDVEFHATKTAINTMIKRGYKVENLLQYTKFSKNDVLFMTQL